MKIRSSIFWLVASVVVVLSFFIWFAKKSVVVSSSTVTEFNAVPPSAQGAATKSNQSKFGSIIHTNALAANNISGTNMPSTPPQSKAEQIKEGLAALNDPTIDFYGKLEDQFGNPVTGAQIKGDIRIYNGVQSTVEHLTTASDANGLFQISGKHGESLSVIPHKDGYALASLNGGGVYSAMWPDNQRVHPDPNNPVVIKMWKLQGAEPLASVDQHYKLPFVDAPVYFDLIAGKTVPTGGDIKIIVNRPEGVVSQRHPQDWSLNIEVVNGGLIETSMAEARITYKAPDGGYHPSDTIVMSTTNHWSNLAQEMFFVSSRNGQVYSKVFLSFDINANPDDPMSITFRGVANPNGSRNWEGDPNTMKPQ